MMLIAHRGNLYGPEPEKENHPLYIAEALKKGYNVEIDVWYTDGGLYLGHDEPLFNTDITFISSIGLWLHAKDYKTLKFFVVETSSRLNYFYHTDEDYVLTSQNYIWAYPGKSGNSKTICVMPEWGNYPLKGFAGVCSDYVGNYDDQTNTIRSRWSANKG